MKYNFLGIFIISIIALSGCKAKKKEPSFEHAIAALEHKNIQEAITFLDTSIAHDPQPRYYALKGTLLYQLHDFKGSKKVFEKVLKKKNINPILKAEVLNNYACVLNQLGDHQGAQTVWEQLIHNNNYTTKEVAWFNLGMASFEHGVESQKSNPYESHRLATLALKQFKNALSLEPRYVDALFYQAQTQLLCKNKKGAVNSLKKLISIAPQHPSAQELLSKYS